MHYPEIFDHVFDVGTIEKLDYERAFQITAELLDGWKPGACTAVANTLDDGSTVIARNMDLTICNNPAFVYRTAEPGKHRAFGLTFIHFFVPSCDQVRAEGLDDITRSLLPFMSSDAMNEHGLYVETNMRTGETFADGTSKFGCSGTNPDSPTRICASMLPCYLTQNCASIEEALELAHTLDIYSMSTDLLDWGLAFMMVDATGRYGLLEVAANKLVWHEGQPAQANFYLTPEWAAIEDYKAGWGENGRYDVVMKGREAAKTREAMWELIDRVRYSISDLAPEDQTYDVRTEYVGPEEEEDYRHADWTTDYVLADENKAELEDFMRAHAAKVAGMTRQEIQDAAFLWESALTILADPSNLTIKVRFFEDDDRTMTLSLD